MTYATSVPVARLTFSNGFRYYGDATAVTPSATVNLPVDQITHDPTGETLTDGATIPAQDINAYDVPDPRAKGWTSGRSHVSKWSYDVALTITATGQPSLLWTATISPRRSTEVITPGMGRLAGSSSSQDGGATGPVTVTETAPGEYTIGA